MYIHKYLINAIGSQKYHVSLCLFDLSAAFDTSDHNILLSRLSSWFGITGTVLDWFKSSLSSRPFRVKCESSFSFLYLFCGVPQVSVLCPGFYHVHHPSQFTHLISFSKSPFCTPMIRNFSFRFILQMYIRA